MASMTPLPMTRRAPKGVHADRSVRPRPVDGYAPVDLTSMLRGESAGFTDIERLTDGIFRRHYKTSSAESEIVREPDSKEFRRWTTSL